MGQTMYIGNKLQISIMNAARWAKGNVRMRDSNWIVNETLGNPISKQKLICKTMKIFHMYKASLLYHLSRFPSLRPELAKTTNYIPKIQKFERNAM